MDPRQDDSAPARSSDTGGTLYRATHDDISSERDRAAAADPTSAARATTVIPYWFLQRLRACDKTLLSFA
jgi:hypothetical protein